MSELTPNQDIIDIPWDIAQAANRAYNAYKDACGVLEIATKVSNSNIDGIEVSGDDLCSLSRIADDAYLYHDRVVKIAGLFINSEISPFSSTPNKATKTPEI